MDIITVDFETFYSKTYDLKKYTTEAYIRDPQFEVICLSLKLNNEPARWYSGADMHDFIHEYDYSDKAVLAHNCSFDGAIMSWHYGVKPKLWLDTAAMARPFHGSSIGVSLRALSKAYGLGEKGDEVYNAIGKRREDFTPVEMLKYASYCVTDNELTYKLARELLKKFPKEELLTIDRTLRMFTEPKFELDKELLVQHLHNVRTNKTKLMDRLRAEGQSDEDVRKFLMSNEKFAHMLRALGVEPPTKASPRTGLTTYAFAKQDKEFTALAEHPNQVVQHLVSARLGVKSTLEETRTETFIEIAGRGGTLPVPLMYYGAHTGRFSGSDKINLQNLTRKSPIRKAIRAPKGYKVVAADSSQIEARMLAYVAGQDDVVEAFANKRDVYSEFASKVYGRTITKANEAERFVGKTCVLALGYGTGAEKLRNTLALGIGGPKVEIDEDESKRIVYVYRTANHKITGLWNRSGHMLKNMCLGNSGTLCDMPNITYEADRIILPNTLPIVYNGLQPSTNGFSYRSRKGPEKLYGGKVVENLIQALACLVIKHQMNIISTRYPLALQVHDEIVIVVPEDQEVEARAFLTLVMSTPPPWCPGLPVACEVGSGDSYGECK